MRTVDVLCRARHLYATSPDHTPGHIITIPDENHCIVKALVYAAFGTETGTDDSPHEPAFEAAKALMRRLAGRELPDWNACHTTEQALGLFDRAIAAAQTREQEFTTTTTTELVTA